MAETDIIGDALIGPDFVIGATAGEEPTAAGRDTGPAVTNPFSYYSFDLLTGRFLGQLPFRGVTFGQQLDAVGTFTGTLDLQDPRVQSTEPLSNSAPNRSLLLVDYLGSPLWGGIALPRKWKVEASLQSTSRPLEVGCSELWSYFQGRVQATDYSSPPTPGSPAPAKWNIGRARRGTRR